jgi:SAC3/GANP family
MHELCEYNKGEGFSEGFDAHLNIEQMNKASVELFQMYEDHRRKGISVCTEREFRGYYALLKLDKHPGYKASALFSFSVFPLLSFCCDLCCTGAIRYSAGAVIQ